MKNSKGFKKLKGLASVGAISLSGLFGAVGSGRAGGSSVSTGFSISAADAVWSNFGNNVSFPSSTDVTTTNGDVYPATFNSSNPSFCYADASVSVNSNSFTDAFDCAMILSVEGNKFINPDTTVDLSGNTVTSDTVVDITPAINAQIQYRAYENRNLMRGLFTLTNTGPGPIALSAAIMGDYGSDSNTTVLASSDDDTTIENSDLWFITDENTAIVGNDPIITTTRHGVDADVQALNAFTPSDANAAYVLRYPLDIPAGGTVRIMTFHEMAPADLAELPGLIAAARDLESMTALDAAGLIDDLDQSVRDSIVNYGDSDIIFKNGFE